jgi:hypothetical protein
MDEEEGVPGGLKMSKGLESYQLWSMEGEMSYIRLR